MTVYHTMESPHNTLLELTIISSFIGSDVSHITDEDSFINTQPTSILKRCDMYCMYYRNNDFFHII